jgi:hypothetical protein
MTPELVEAFGRFAPAPCESSLGPGGQRPVRSRPRVSYSIRTNADIRGGLEDGTHEVRRLKDLRG